jgi:hypothetical protein
VTNPATATPLPTFTPTPSNTSPPPNVPSGAQIVTATALQTQRGTANGSLSSLSVLKQSGTEDNPAEYVTFQPQGSSYEGYLSFNPPANFPAESVSAVSLRVNFKGTATSKQNWIWSIYDWNKKEWVKLGTASGKQSQWQLLELNIPLRKQYGSAQNEVWIQLRSNNAAGNAKIDYQVLQITSSAPASAQTILQPTATLISPTPGTSPTEAATSTPHHHP